MAYETYGKAMDVGNSLCSVHSFVTNSGWIVLLGNPRAHMMNHARGSRDGCLSLRRKKGIKTKNVRSSRPTNDGDQLLSRGDSLPDAPPNRLLKPVGEDDGQRGVRIHNCLNRD